MGIHRCCSRNEGWRTTCVECGRRLGSPCARCGHVNASAKSCAGCGATFLPQRDREPPIVERFAIPFW